MKFVSLNETEIKEAKKIISKYKELEKSLSRVQTQLEKLDNERKLLMKSLDQTRNNEENFFSKLNSVYGKGKLDLYTMKYIVNEDDKSAS